MQPDSDYIISIIQLLAICIVDIIITHTIKFKRILAQQEKVYKTKYSAIVCQRQHGKDGKHDC